LGDLLGLNIKLVLNSFLNHPNNVNPALVNVENNLFLDVLFNLQAGRYGNTSVDQVALDILKTIVHRFIVTNNFIILLFEQADKRINILRERSAVDTNLKVVLAGSVVGKT
jgi:hypothetical protein